MRERGRETAAELKSGVGEGSEGEAQGDGVGRQKESTQCVYVTVA